MEIELTDDVSRVLEDENIDIVVELMGGIENHAIVKRALEMVSQWLLRIKHF